ncbi:MAG: nucleotidyltransferase domain-containing protein, partial [Ruminiclostridium sp.]|nr:nucleotidyltransferase domain-containing protein [Ruminiclostridium sp.]
MEKVIAEKLKEIEKNENVKIIHCIESGSRAWGFASPDSDYDVRFIYVRPTEYYLRLDKTADVIEWQLDDVLDINGWDIKKALILLHKSNPTLFEWNGSPIVYRTTEQWKKVSDIINGFFIRKSGVYHYLSTAKSNYREYLKGEHVRLKKYFYVIRPILACKWILKEQTPPPMLFSELAERYLDKEIMPEVDRLLDVKMKTPEITVGKRIDALNRY